MRLASFPAMQIFVMFHAENLILPFNLFTRPLFFVDYRGCATSCYTLNFSMSFSLLVLYIYIPEALKRNHRRPKCIWCSSTTLIGADASQSCKNRFSSAGNSLSSVCLLYSSLEKSKKGQKRIGNRRWQCLIFLFLLLDCCYQPLLYSI